MRGESRSARRGPACVRDILDNLGSRVIKISDIKLLKDYVNVCFSTKIFDFHRIFFYLMVI